MLLAHLCPCTIACSGLQAVASQRDSEGSEGSDMEPEQLPGMTKPRRLQQLKEREQEQEAQVRWQAPHPALCMQASGSIVGDGPSCRPPHPSRAPCVRPALPCLQGRRRTFTACMPAARW